MIRQSHKEILSKLPDTPGVYFFRRGKDILYIGKATSLKDRVKSYFSNDLHTTRGPLIVKLMEEFDDITFQQTDSVLEALILEAHLIKQYQPYYNTKEKSDKSFNYVVITKEDFPRVLLVRGRDLEMSKTAFGIPKAVFDTDVAYSFGPFPNGSVIREALVLVRKIFPFRDKCIPKSELKDLTKAKPCFNRQIGLCPGVCMGEISKEEYHQTILNIVRFFRGEKKLIIKDLEKRMKVFAKAREFEKAGELKRQIFALNHIHDISLIKSDSLTSSFNLQTSIYRVEAYDVAHTAGKDVVGVMTVVENGIAQKSEYRKFKIKMEKNNDVGSLREMLQRRLNHEEWRLPNLIVVDGAAAQKNAAESVLSEFGYQIPVVAVTKNEYHKPKNILGLSAIASLRQAGERQHLSHESEILLANNEAHRYGIAYHKKLRDRLK